LIEMIEAAEIEPTLDLRWSFDHRMIVSLSERVGRSSQAACVLTAPQPSLRLLIRDEVPRTSAAQQAWRRLAGAARRAASLTLASQLSGRHHT
jgi:hypothetical protein